ncbi:unnamed protein product [Trichobilharzia szidati]|nr:unnamed protein product [Trichobilharzia szidati]
MSKPTFDNLVDDVQLLISRMRSREDAADVLRQQASKLQAQLLSMRQCREETLGFDEFSKCVSGHPKGQLLMCLAAENKQLEQLRIENKTLRNSLDEHDTALDMIMSKYRGQISKLLRTNQVEQFVQSMMMPELNEITYQNIPGHDIPCPNKPTQSQSVAYKPKLDTNNITTDGSCKVEETKDTPLVQSLTEQLTTVASIVREVADQGDAYATELEEELHRLRSENAGLRELLMISSEHCPDNNISDSVHLPAVSLSSSSSNKEQESMLTYPTRGYSFLNHHDIDSNSSSRRLTCIDDDHSLRGGGINRNAYLYDDISCSESVRGDSAFTEHNTDHHSNIDSGDEDVSTVCSDNSSSDESQTTYPLYFREEVNHPNDEYT